MGSFNLINLEKNTQSTRKLDNFSLLNKLLINHGRTKIVKKTLSE